MNSKILLGKIAHQLEDFHSRPLLSIEKLVVRAADYLEEFHLAKSWIGWIQLVIVRDKHVFHSFCGIVLI